MLQNNHPFIEALLDLPEAERNNPAAIQRCFNAYPMDETHASYRVYMAFFRNRYDENRIAPGPRMVGLHAPIAEPANREENLRYFARIAQHFR